MSLFLIFYLIVGTCSLQGNGVDKELLPDAMCYDVCTNNVPIRQQRYLMCNDMKCFCRTMHTDSSIPLNAGNISEQILNNNTLLSTPAQGGNSSMTITNTTDFVTPLNAGIVSDANFTNTSVNETSETATVSSPTQSDATNVTALLNNSTISAGHLPNSTGPIQMTSLQPPVLAANVNGVPSSGNVTTPQ